MEAPNPGHISKMMIFLFFSFRCNKQPVLPVPGCTPVEQDKYESPAFCGIILDNKGPFAVCHPRVNPNVSYKCAHYKI